MIKAKTWPGKDLKGLWHVTLKVDGVRCLWSGKEWLSRADKPLYNLPPFDGRTDCEAFCGSLKETIQKVRAKTKPRPVSPEEMFSLNPLDPRLDLGTLVNPTAIQVKDLLRKVNAQGHEGLVLRKLGDDVVPVWYKVKPSDNFDVPVTGVFEGEGKHAGRMGYVTTPMGDVGTGFTDEEREDWWRNRKKKIGVIIEVSCMQLTPDGKFRHAAFERERFDKK